MPNPVNNSTKFNYYDMMILLNCIHLILFNIEDCTDHQDDDDNARQSFDEINLQICF